MLPRFDWSLEGDPYGERAGDDSLGDDSRGIVRGIGPDEYDLLR